MKLNLSIIMTWKGFQMKRLIENMILFQTCARPYAVLKLKRQFLTKEIIKIKTLKNLSVLYIQIL